MASPIPIPSNGLAHPSPTKGAEFGTGRFGGSASSITPPSGATPPSSGPTPPSSLQAATYFGKSQMSSPTVKSSVVNKTKPPSPSTVKRLLRIRKMSEMSRSSPVGGSVTTIPTQPSDINISWAKIVINQHRIKDFQPPLPSKAEILRFVVNDCKKSSGDLSTTCRISVDVRVEEDVFNYVFIAKLLPADDPCRVYVFESNVFEKEISIYFELLPALRQFCEGTKLEKVMSNRIPHCIYGSNNCDGAGVLVFECAQEKGFYHPEDPKGLSLDQVRCTVQFMAQFHAIGSAILIKKGKVLNLRYPFLSCNVYSSPLMQEGARHMFHVYTEFLQSVSGEAALHHKFTKYCNEECAAKEMFTCLRRQVDSPFNTIIHGELWEKNMLFATEAAVEVGGDQELRGIILDWKNAKIASATKDLAFLLLSSTSHALRQKYLTDILETYHAIFCASLETLGVDTKECKGLSYEDFFADYAMSTKGAFLQSVCVLVQEMSFMEHKAQHAENLTVYERRALDLMKDQVLNETHFV